MVIIEIKEYETGTIFTFGYEENIYKVISPLIGKFNVYENMKYEVHDSYEEQIKEFLWKKVKQKDTRKRCLLF